MTGIMAEGVTRVGLALKEKKEKNIQNALKLQGMCETFELKIGEAEFTAIMLPMSVESDIFDDWGKLEPDEYAKKHFDAMFGFGPEIIDQLNRKTISLLMNAYCEGYGRVMRDRSFLGPVGSE